MNLLRPFLEDKEIMAKFQKFYIKMDNCSLVDSDVTCFQQIQFMDNLESLEISIERNRLSNQSSHTF